MESQFRKTVVAALRPLHAISIENGVGAGTPDVNFRGGWLELKELPAWPVRASTPVRIKHLRPEQIVFMVRRSLACGRCWLFLKVGRDHLLFPGSKIQEIGLLTRAQLVESSDWTSLAGFDAASLLEYLSQW